MSIFFFFLNKPYENTFFLFFRVLNGQIGKKQYDYDHIIFHCGFWERKNRRFRFKIWFRFKISLLNHIIMGEKKQVIKTKVRALVIYAGWFIVIWSVIDILLR